MPIQTGLILGGYDTTNFFARADDMPGFGKKLKARDITALTKYVRSL